MAWNGMRTLKSTIVVAGVAVALSACSPVVKNHGYAPVPEEMTDIRVGLDTRGTVQSKIGRPGGTAVFREDGWFYVASKVEHYMYYEPKVVDRRVVAILFDENDIVASISSYGLEDGKIVNLETGTTPTYGREMTILEQLFFNIGTIPADVFTTE